MISVEGVSKIYHTRAGPRRVLDDLSFTIEKGQSIGIMGRNGAGKSTLTRLLSGVEAPTSGRVVRTMSVSWPLGYSVALQPSLTGADNARFVARIYNVPIPQVLAYVEDFAELGPYFDMPIKTYSAGMAARLSFGISLAIDFDCYLVDEIVGAGDYRFADRCKAAMLERRARGALIMISHDPETLKNYCESGALLSGGRLQFFDTIDQTAEAYHAL